VGNEADVELYVNHTGLMWETAEACRALLVFAEHRYYGQSKPRFADGAPLLSHMGYLSSEQALADNAALLFQLRQEAPDSPVIAFGGSYGGMLASWLRIKYPSSVDGVIAGSAPIWAFEGEAPPPDAGGYSAAVTRNAGAAAGGASSAAPACVPNLQAGWQALRSSVESGWEALSDLFRLCPDSRLRSAGDVEVLANWLSGAWSYLAMGNFPYQSDYLTNGHGVLPAWPVKEACTHLAEPGLEGDALMRGLRDAAAVFYNVSGAVACYSTSGSANNETAEDGLFWGWQSCTEMEMPMETRGAPWDAFWPAPWSEPAFSDACFAQWRVRPRPLWASVAYGGKALRAASNIVFSNGALDPWAYGGVNESLGVASLVPLLVAGGAHHLDLMFSHPRDPQSVLDVRARERAEIARWIAEARARAPPLRAACPAPAPSRPTGAEELKRWGGPLVLVFLLGGAVGGGSAAAVLMRLRHRQARLRAAIESAEDEATLAGDVDEAASLEASLIPTVR